MNVKIAVLSALLILMAENMYGQDNVIDEVVWVVGDEAILKSDVENMRLDYQLSGQRINGNPRCVIPEQMAIQKLFLNQAALDSIQVTDAEVIRRVDDHLNHLVAQLGSRERMEAYFNKSYSQIREAQRDNVRQGMIMQRMQEKLVGDIKVTPSEVRKYFKDLPSDSIPYVPTQVEVQIIMAQPKIPIEEIDDIKARLREYTDRVNKKETDFATLARLYSQDGSARQGGETGYKGKGEFVPEFANVAFNLTDPTKVSKIVETEYGYHIIQLIEKRGDRINVRHILIKPEPSAEEIKASIGRLDSIANDIKSGKFTFEDAAILSSDKDTRNNHGLMQNMQTGTARFEMQELPPAIATVVDKMQVGEISQAFSMINMKTGKDVCAIIKLKNRINGHKATISEDYQRLKDIVLQKKRQEVLDKWINEKMKKTYVRINEGWRDCHFQHEGWLRND